MKGKQWMTTMISNGQVIVEERGLIVSVFSFSATGRGVGWGRR